ncbi:hypothetical protein [Allohahella sp. A8]|uniref:hypothetical protein n=1 Tax=Allohahella sp. A8 TaxID=3141461 RepID=UPI003A80B21E
MDRSVAASYLGALIGLFLTVGLSACSSRFLEPDPRFARLASELENAGYASQSAPVNSREWVELINSGLEYGHTLFYSSSERRWVLASRDVQFDLFEFSQLDEEKVRARLSLPGREGSDSGGNTASNEVHAKVRPDAEPIRRLFRSGHTDEEYMLRLPMRESSGAINGAKILRYLAASKPSPA